MAGDDATRGAVKAKSDARKSSESNGGLVKMILSGSDAAADAAAVAGFSCGPAVVSAAAAAGFSDGDVEGLVIDSSLIGCCCCCCCSFCCCC